MQSPGAAAIPPHTARPGGEEGWLLYISVYTGHASTGVYYPDTVETLGSPCSSVPLFFHLNRQLVQGKGR